MDLRVPYNATRFSSGCITGGLLDSAQFHTETDNIDWIHLAGCGTVDYYKHGNESSASVKRWETVGFSRSLQNGSAGKTNARMPGRN
jgi:hypothetical protein